MKALLTICALILAGCVTTTQPDALFPDRTLLLREGQTQHYIVPDATVKDRYRIRDSRKGTTKSTIIPDRLFPGRYIIRRGVW